jgi:hypothetical protein
MRSLTFPTTGFVRLVSIIEPHGPIPVGRSTWWAGVKSGRFLDGRHISKSGTMWDNLWGGTSPNARKPRM